MLAGGAIGRKAKPWQKRQGFYVGGDGGSRTPVQNLRLIASYMRSRRFRSQQAVPPAGCLLASRIGLSGFAPANFTAAPFLGDARLRFQKGKIRANALSRGRRT
jgi:hypothetical protein